MLELARQLKGKKLENRIDLVAYTLEEPPYFRSKEMGSYVHAKSLKDDNVPVIGMISIEMIGYFDEAKNSQTYPIGLLKLFYGNIGDYITMVRKFGAGKFARKFSRQYKRTKTIKTKNLSSINN